MTAYEFEHYWAPARDALYPNLHESRLEASIKMRSLLGSRAYIEHRQYFLDSDYPMSEELKSILRLLNSPHAQTILKVYRIKKGMEVLTS